MSIKYLVMDVDGTLTDGKIYMSGADEEFKAFNIKDGYGIHDLIQSAGIIPIIITGRSSDIVARRCVELNIKEVYQGVSDKLAVLIKIADDLSEVAYIGDDLNDIPCMKQVQKSGGIVGCPADAAEDVIKLADFVCFKNGGNGAVREFIDWIMK